MSISQQCILNEVSLSKSTLKTRLCVDGLMYVIRSPQELNFIIPHRCNGLTFTNFFQILFRILLWIMWINFRFYFLFHTLYYDILVYFPIPISTLHFAYYCFEILESSCLGPSLCFYSSVIWYLWSFVFLCTFYILPFKAKTSIQLMAWYWIDRLTWGNIFCILMILILLANDYDLSFHFYLFWRIFNKTFCIYILYIFDRVNLKWHSFDFSFQFWSFTNTWILALLTFRFIIDFWMLILQVFYTLFSYILSLGYLGLPRHTNTFSLKDENFLSLTIFSITQSLHIFLFLLYHLILQW